MNRFVRAVFICMLFSIMWVYNVFAYTTTRIGNDYVINYTEDIGNENEALINSLGATTLKESDVKVYAVILNKQEDVDIESLKEQLGMYSEDSSVAILLYELDESSLDIYLSKSLESKLKDKELGAISNYYDTEKEKATEGTAEFLAYSKFCQMISDITNGIRRIWFIVCMFIVVMSCMLVFIGDGTRGKK